MTHKILRWYPLAWRQRYGEELLALMADRNDAGDLRTRDELSVVRAGLTERARETGFVGNNVAPDVRLRGGALGVLCAWALFVIAGSVFAKYSEHFGDLMIPRNRRAPDLGYALVQYAAFAGAAIVGAAAIVLVPTLWRHLRSSERRDVWPAIRRSIVASTLAAGVSAGVIAWAHRAAVSTHVGGTWPLRTVGVVWGLVLLSFLVVAVHSVVAVVTKLRPTPGVTRFLGACSLVVTLVMAVVLAGTIVWWVAMAQNGPQFFGNFVNYTTRARGSLAPLTIDLVGTAMVVGFVAALSFARRVVVNFSLVSSSLRGPTTS